MGRAIIGADSEPRWCVAFPREIVTGRVARRLNLGEMVENSIWCQRLPKPLECLGRGGGK